MRGTPRGRRATERFRRAGAFAGAGLLCLAVVGLGRAPPSHAQAGSVYTGTASASLVRSAVTTEPPMVFDPMADPGATVAQAELDSLGGSSAFASSPYPSESVVLLPGLMAGLTEGATSDVVPDYPLIATSSHPTRPQDRVSAGPLVLEAVSRAHSTRSDARDGASHAVAEVFVEDSGAVVSRSEVTLASVRITDLLTVHGLRSLAEVRQDPSGERTRTSRFEVASLQVAGQRVAVGPDGLTAGEDDPQGPSLGQLDALLAGLALEGTTLEVAPAVETEDGIITEGLRVRNRSEPPQALASGVSEVISDVTLGATSAFLTNTAFPAVGGFDPPPPAVAPGVPGAVPPSPVPGGEVATAGPGDGAGVPAGGAPPAARPSAPLAQEPLGATGGPAVPLDISLVGVYWALFAAGALLVACANLVRHLGVRTP